MSTSATLDRRQFLAAASLATLAAPSLLDAATAAEPIIDIHQHTNYHGRTQEQMLAHQRAMGVTMTILLPSGSPMTTPSTHGGKSNGLAARTGGNQLCTDFAYEHPDEFTFFANEVTDHEFARKNIETFLIKGARGIGEQKFGVQCDSKESEVLYKLAEQYNVPILLHFQEGTYNSGFDRFHKVLAKFPKVNFIMHAQTTWANIDAAYDGKSLYPTGPVKRGGLTSKYLADYANCYADMSAGSGLRALLRDEDHTRWFLEKFQDKILYGSDCADTIGRGPGCQGTQTIAAIRRYAASKQIERKILFENSVKLFDL
jgi:predicted TIM-barrel fold metal-dependent hydrolase